MNGNYDNGTTSIKFFNRIDKRILNYLSQKKLATASKITKVLGVDKRYVIMRLRTLVMQGKIGLVVCVERFIPYENYRKVIYYVDRNSFNEVVKWLKSNSNILVKMKLLLPKGLLE